MNQSSNSFQGTNGRLQKFGNLISSRFMQLHRFSHHASEPGCNYGFIMAGNQLKPIMELNTDLPLSMSGGLKKVCRIEEEISSPFPDLPSGFLEMRVKEGSKIRNLMGFAMARMQDDGLKQVVFSGSSRALTKTITCAEIMKRKIEGLHQITKLQYKSLREVWEKNLDGAGGESEVMIQKKIPSISILLSKDPLNTLEPGYQPPNNTTNPVDPPNHAINLLNQLGLNQSDNPAINLHEPLNQRPNFLELGYQPASHTLNPLERQKDTLNPLEPTRSTPILDIPKEMLNPLQSQKDTRISLELPKDILYPLESPSSTLDVPKEMLKPLQPPKNMENPLESQKCLLDPLDLPKNIAHKLGPPKSTPNLLDFPKGKSQKDTLNSLEPPKHIANPPETPKSMLNPLDLPKDMVHKLNPSSAPNSLDYSKGMLKPPEPPMDTINQPEAQMKTIIPMKPSKNTLKQLETPKRMQHPPRLPKDKQNPLEPPISSQNQLKPSEKKLNLPETPQDTINKQKLRFQPLNSLRPPNHWLYSKNLGEQPQSPHLINAVRYHQLNPVDSLNHNESTEEPRNHTQTKLKPSSHALNPLEMVNEHPNTRLKFLSALEAGCPSKYGLNQKTPSNHVPNTTDPLNHTLNPLDHHEKLLLRLLNTEEPGFQSKIDPSEPLNHILFTSISSNYSQNPMEPLNYTPKKVRLYTASSTLNPLVPEDQSLFPRLTPRNHIDNAVETSNLTPNSSEPLMHSLNNPENPNNTLKPIQYQALNRFNPNLMQIQLKSPKALETESQPLNYRLLNHIVNPLDHSLIVRGSLNPQSYATSKVNYPNDMFLGPSNRMDTPNHVGSQHPKAAVKRNNISQLTEKPSRGWSDFDMESQAKKHRTI